MITTEGITPCHNCADFKKNYINLFIKNIILNNFVGKA